MAKQLIDTMQSHWEWRRAMGDVEKLGYKLQDATLLSPRDALEDALESIGKENEGAFYKGKKLLILALDEDEGYDISFSQAGMKMSDCITLCEVAKTVFLRNMGYLPSE